MNTYKRITLVVKVGVPRRVILRLKQIKGKRVGAKRP